MIFKKLENIQYLIPIQKQYKQLILLQIYIEQETVTLFINEEAKGTSNCKLVNRNHKLIMVNLFLLDLEDSDSLVKRISKIIENEIKEQKGGFISMFLGTSGTALYLEIC